MTILWAFESSQSIEQKRKLSSNYHHQDGNHHFKESELFFNAVHGNLDDLGFDLLHEGKGWNMKILRNR